MDESAQALQHAKKAAAAKDAECERAVAKHAAAEADAAAVRDELALKAKEVSRLEDSLSKASASAAPVDAGMMDPASLMKQAEGSDKQAQVMVKMINAQSDFTFFVQLMRDKSRDARKVAREAKAQG